MTVFDNPNLKMNYPNYPNMTQKEAILHQNIAVIWHNQHRNNPGTFQRLICQWNNAPTKQYGNKMRSMGVKPGIADWLFLAKDGKSIWLELKVEDGKQSLDQIKFESLCRSLNHEYYIVRSEEEFFKIINIYL